MEVKNNSDSYTVEMKSEDSYSVEGLDGFDLNKTSISALKSDSAGVAATQLVKEQAEDLSIYGLDSPKAEATITYKDGETLSLAVGNEAAGDAGTYVTVNGESRVYLFNSAKVDTFAYPLLEYVSKEITPSQEEAVAAANGGEPSVSAKAAVLMTADNSTVLYEKAAEEKLPMASTTKIMTALLTLEAAQAEDRQVKITDEMVRVEGSSMGLKPGNVVTLTALAQGMLLCSGNDAANRDHGRRDSQTNSHDQPDQQGNKRYEPGEQRQTAAYDLHQSYGSLAAGSGIKHGKVFLFLHDRGLDLPVNGSGRRGRGTGGGFHRLADGFASHIYGLAHGLTDRLVQLLKVPGIDGSVHNVLNASSKIVPVLIFICHTILSKKYSLSL